MITLVLFILSQTCLLLFFRQVFLSHSKLKYLATALLIFSTVILVYLHLDPIHETEWFKYKLLLPFHGWGLYLIASSFSGMLMGTSQKRGSKNSYLYITLAISICSHYIHDNRSWIFNLSIGSESTPNEHHHLSQTTLSTCGPCASAMALSYFNYSISEIEMAKRCQTTPSGTKLIHVYRGLKMSLPEKDFKVEMKRVTANELAELNQVSVTTWDSLQHEICIVGQGDHVKVHDPLRSFPENWSIETLQKRFNGIAILVTR